MIVDARRTALREQREQARTRIIAAAEETLRRRPYREVTVDEVMQTAGLTRTIFYRHFDDLSDLVLQVGRAAFEGLYETHSRLLETGAPNTASLRAALEPAVATFAEHGPLIRAIVDAGSHDALVEQAHRSIFERYVELTRRFIDEVGSAKARHPEQTARALTLLNEAYLLATFGREPTVSEAVALETLVDIWAATVGIAR